MWTSDTMIRSLILGAILIGYGAYLIYSIKSPNNNCTKATVAKIVDTAETRDDTGRWVYEPVYEFRANGRLWQLTEGKPQPNTTDLGSVGKKCTVYFNEINPEEFFIQPISSRRTGGKVCLTIGIFLVLFFLQWLLSGA